MSKIAFLEQNLMAYLDNSLQQRILQSRCYQSLFQKILFEEYVSGKRKTEWRIQWKDLLFGKWDTEESQRETRNQT